MEYERTHRSENHREAGNSMGAFGAWRQLTTELLNILKYASFANASKYQNTPDGYLMHHSTLHQPA